MKSNVWSHDKLKVELHEQQNCCNLQQNPISTYVKWKCLHINYKSQGNMCRHFYLTCVEIRFCCKLQQFCCSCINSSFKNIAYSLQEFTREFFKFAKVMRKIAIKLRTQMRNAWHSLPVRLVQCLHHGRILRGGARLPWEFLHLPWEFLHLPWEVMHLPLGKFQR